MAHHHRQQQTQEHELLALIEGELSAAERTTLRQRIAAQDAQLLSAIDEMIDQRNALRDLAADEPVLPCDFVAELEPMLARSMLFGDGQTASASSSSTTAHAGGRKTGTAYAPGQVRRQRRRTLLPRRAMELAVAAALLLTVGAGVWTAGIGLGWWASDQRRDVIAQGDGNTSAASTTTANATGIHDADGTTEGHADQQEFSLLAAGSDLHHELTRDALLSATDGSASPTHATDSAATGINSTADRLPAHVALVLRVADTAQTEAALIDTVQHIAGTEASAVIRNFAFSDARRLEADWHRQQRNAPRLDPAMASLDGRAAAERRAAADRYFRELSRRTEAQLQHLRSDTTNVEREAATQLAGHAQLAPDIEQQLRFSAAGATHTISVPVRDLSAVLTRLTEADMHSEAMLSMFEPINILDRVPEIPSDRALSTAERIRLMLEVRASLDALLHSHPDAIVMLPVVVR